MPDELSRTAAQLLPAVALLVAPVLVKSASIRLSALYAAMNVEDMAAPVSAAGV